MRHDRPNPPIPPIPPTRSQDWHPLSLLAGLALWLVTLGNLPLWRALAASPHGQGAAGWMTAGLLGTLLWGALLASLALLVWRPWRRPAGIALLLMAAVGSHFMSAYGVVIDPGMVSNALHTDPGEVRDLIGWPVLLWLLLGVVLPGWWWWRAPVRALPWQRALAHRALAVSGGVVLVALCLWLGFQSIGSLMRNQPSLRYMINPYNTVYAAVRQGAREARAAAQPPRPIGLDARALATPQDPQQAPLVLVVVGETVRAANVGLGGYARDTTPQLQALARAGELTYFSQVEACGTSTQVSVPCLFSRRGRAGLDEPAEENLLDVLQRAGLAVFWLDNQAGCKGVCERVPHQNAHELAAAEACPGGECPDAVLPLLLPELPARLDAERRARGTVIVLHQMGNHGPAYFERSLPPRKAFLPECRTAVLSDCDLPSIVNAYDNAVRETDHLLASLVHWLQAQPRPAALLYVSDHGESLGERGLFLHGMPWALAPEEQKRVPMLLWTSASMRQRLGVDAPCLQAQSARPWSHDNVFHTVASLAQVGSDAVDPGRSIVATCQR